MDYKVFLLTGVPAAGKTTLANKLAELTKPVQIITFGEMILEVKRQEGVEATYQDLRQNPTSEATVDIISKASEQLINKVTELRGQTNVIIDSHAVAKDSFGFRISPDSTRLLERMNLTAIIVLHADHEEISKRIGNIDSGRRAVTPDEVATHERLQDSVAIAYAVATGCPVFIVKAVGTPLDTAERVFNIFDSLQVKYSRL